MRSAVSGLPFGSHAVISETKNDTLNGGIGTLRPHMLCRNEAWSLLARTHKHLCEVRRKRVAHIDASIVVEQVKQSSIANQGATGRSRPRRALSNSQVRKRKASTSYRRVHAWIVQPMCCLKYKGVNISRMGVHKYMHVYIYIYIYI